MRTGGVRHAMTGKRWGRLLAAVIVAAVAAVAGVGAVPGGGAEVAHAQSGENPLEPLDTSSPQATYLAFVAQVDLLEELFTAYQRDRTSSNQSAFTAALEKTETLFDLSQLSDANRSKGAAAAVFNLADVLNRLPEPDVDEIPDLDDVEEADAGGRLEQTEGEGDGTGPVLEIGNTGITDYTLPGTEITIVLIEDGPDAGDYLFSAATVAGLPGWREQVADLPVNDGVVVDDWVQAEANFTGHLIPRSIVDDLPDVLERDFLGSPLWKFVADVVVLGAALGLVVLWRRTIGLRGDPATPRGLVFRLSTPVLAIFLIGVARRFMNEQITHSGELAVIMNLIGTTLLWTSLAWAFWVAAKLVVEWVIATPTISDDSIDAHLLRLLGKVVSVSGAFVLAWVGLSRLGVPTIGLGIGAGVIGVALGLAATSTLENLIGGITLYIDKPFQVGDRIRVDTDFGTVEEIGPRSTSIRRLDDTVTTIPNADASRLKIVNFSERRYLLFDHTVGLRYETTVDQLREIVAVLDARLREHPMVLEDDGDEFPRVRVTGFGASSVDVEVVAHVDTNDFHVFTGVRHELLLLVSDVVDAAGSGFAFPSSTTYLADDTGLPAPTESDLLTIPDDAVPMRVSGRTARGSAGAVESSGEDD